MISLGETARIFRWFLRRLWPVIVEMTIQFGQKSAETLRCSDAELFKNHVGAGARPSCCGAPTAEPDALLLRLREPEAVRRANCFWWKMPKPRPKSAPAHGRGIGSRSATSPRSLLRADAAPKSAPTLTGAGVCQGWGGSQGYESRRRCVDECKLHSRFGLLKGERAPVFHQ